MIKLIMFDLGNVFLKDNGEVYADDVGKKLSQISYESMYDSNFKIELNEISKELNVDEFYLRERLVNYFSNRFHNINPFFFLFYHKLLVKMKWKIKK